MSNTLERRSSGRADDSPCTTMSSRYMIISGMSTKMVAMIIFIS